MVECVSHKDADTPRPLGPDPSEVFDFSPCQDVFINEKETDPLHCGVEILVDWLEDMALAMTATGARTTQDYLPVYQRSAPHSSPLVASIWQAFRRRL